MKLPVEILYQSFRYLNLEQQLELFKAFHMEVPLSYYKDCFSNVVHELDIVKTFVQVDGDLLKFYNSGRYSYLANPCSECHSGADFVFSSYFFVNKLCSKCYFMIYHKLK